MVGLRAAALSVLVKCATAALMLATTAVLARLLPAAEFGIYALAATVMVLVAQPAGFALATLGVRVASQAHVRQDHDLLSGFVRFAVLAPVLYAVTIIFLTAAYANLTPWGANQALMCALASAAPLLVALPWGEAMGALQRSSGAPLAGQVPDQILRHVFFFIFLAAALALVGLLGVTPPRVLALQAAGAGIASLVSFAMLRRLLGAKMRTAVPRYAVAEWTGRLWPLGLVAGAQAVSANADLLVVGTLLPPAEAGIYRVAVQVGLLVAFPLSAVAAVATPRLAALQARAERSAMQHLLSRSAQGLVAIAVPAALALVFVGDVILGRIFGAAFERGAPALAILAIAQVLNAATGPVGIVLSTLGFEREAFRGVVVGAVVNIALSLLLVPRFGLTGAALAASAGLVCLNLTLVALLYSRTGLLSLPYAPGAIARAR